MLQRSIICSPATKPIFIPCTLLFLPTCRTFSRRFHSRVVGFFLINCPRVPPQLHWDPLFTEQNESTTLLFLCLFLPSTGFFGCFCGAARMESVSDLKSARLSSVTVNIISCLFGNAAPGFLQLAVAFLCIIIAPEHFLRADKSRHDVCSDRLRSARNSCNLFSHF